MMWGNRAQARSISLTEVKSQKLELGATKAVGLEGGSPRKEGVIKEEPQNLYKFPSNS